LRMPHVALHMPRNEQWCVADDELHANGA